MPKRSASIFLLLVVSTILLHCTAADSTADVIADFGSCKWSWAADNGAGASCAPFVVSSSCGLTGTPIILAAGYLTTQFVAEIPGVIVTYTIKGAGYALAIANGVEGNGMNAPIECPPSSELAGGFPPNSVLTGGFLTRVGMNTFSVRTRGMYYDAKLEAAGGVTGVRSLSWGKLKLIYR